MIRAAGVVVLALALFTTQSHAAAGINLSWSDCDSIGTANKTFACNTNSGSEVLVGSFVAPDGISQLVGTEMTLDVVADGDSLPSWWAFKNAGACRSTALSVDFSYGGSTCTDYWGGAGGATGGIGAYTVGYSGGNTVRITLVTALPPDAASALTADTQYFDFNLNISHAHTTGGSACAGCATGATITLTSINLVQPAGVGDDLITSPATRNYATWQGGAGMSPSIPLKTRFGQILTTWH